MCCTFTCQSQWCLNSIHTSHTSWIFKQTLHKYDSDLRKHTITSNIYSIAVLTSRPAPPPQIHSPRQHQLQSTLHHSHKPDHSCLSFTFIIYMNIHSAVTLIGIGLFLIMNVPVHLELVFEQLHLLLPPTEFVTLSKQFIKTELFNACDHAKQAGSVW